PEFVFGSKATGWHGCHSSRQEGLRWAKRPHDMQPALCLQPWRSFPCADWWFRLDHDLYGFVLFGLLLTPLHVTLSSAAPQWMVQCNYHFIFNAGDATW